MPKPHEQERERFAAVMAARTSTKDLIGLFDKLGDSEKFSWWAKPYCFADLIEVCAERVPASALDALLETMSWNWVGDVVYRVYEPAEARKRIAPLVRKVVELSSHRDDILERRLRKLSFSGAVDSTEQALEIALEAGLPVKNLEQAKAALARIAARPPEEVECPF